MKATLPKDRPGKLPRVRYIRYDLMTAAGCRQAGVDYYGWKNLYRPSPKTKGKDKT